MDNEHETPEQRRKRLRKAKEHIDRLEQGHLNDAPKPLSRSQPSEPLSRMPPMDLVK